MSKILRGLNEVNAQNYDSDIDYYNALNRKPRGRSEDDYVEPEDPYQDLYRKQDAEMAKYKKEVNIQYVNKEGSAPNGERYNGAFIVRAKTPYQGDNEIYKFNDAHWGAKKIVDTVKKQPDEQGEPYTTIVYYVDNHKHGYWKPWKDEPPISKGVEFTEEIMREGISQEDLADLLFHRLELRYPDVVQRYGHEVVGDIVLDVAGFHEGADELGTSDIGIMIRQIMRKLEDYANEQINELSPQTLASYKTKAGADASAADKRGDFARGNKRFSGIVRATNKQFANDAKGIKESQTEGEATLAQIARAGDDGYEMIEDGLNGLLGTEAQIILQDMYNDVSIEHRLHPDDDFEQIFDRMMDRIEQDYGVNESYFDRGDYYNARVGGEYGKGLTPQELGSAHYVSHGDGPKGRPAKVRGVSNKLPADPFGRTSGAVPRDIGVGKIHRIAGPGDDVDEGMVMGVSSDASSAGSRVQGEGTQQMGVGSKVYHPIHGSGKVVKHSTGAGADHWAEVKFVRGDTKKVNRKHLKLEKEQGVTEAEKNPHTSAIGKALYRALSKQPKLSPQQVQRNKERWAQRQKEQGNDDMRMDEINEDWQKVNKKDKTDGMSRKAVKAYRRENPGSKLKTAVTTKPSKLKKGSKAAKRRKSFCARMSGMKKAHASAKTKRDPDSPINKALRRWNCESVEQLHELMMIAEQKVQALREAANPAQQAAIAVNMKKKGQKPKSESAIEKGIVDENLGLPNPGTYEQETAPIKRKGQQERVQKIAFESKK